MVTMVVAHCGNTAVIFLNAKNCSVEARRPFYLIQIQTNFLSGPVSAMSFEAFCAFQQPALYRRELSLYDVVKVWCEKKVS